MLHARVLFVAVAVGCGDDTAPLIDAPLDSSAGSTIDAPPVACALPASLGSPTLLGSTGRWERTDRDAIFGAGPINADPKPDFLFLDMYEGYGAFYEGYPTTPSSIELGGFDAQLADCGACVRIGGDVDVAIGIGQQYMAMGGTLELDGISRTELRGRLRFVSLVHVDVDTDGTSTPAPSGCRSSLSLLEFAIVIAQ